MSLFRDKWRSQRLLSLSRRVVLWTIQSFSAPRRRQTAAGFHLRSISSPPPRMHKLGEAGVEVTPACFARRRKQIRSSVADRNRLGKIVSQNLLALAQTLHREDLASCRSERPVRTAGQYIRWPTTSPARPCVARNALATSSFARPRYMRKRMGTKANWVRASKSRRGSWLVPLRSVGTRGERARRRSGHGGENEQTTEISRRFAAAIAVWSSA